VNTSVLITIKRTSQNVENVVATVLISEDLNMLSFSNIKSRKVWKGLFCKFFGRPSINPKVWHEIVKDGTKNCSKCLVRKECWKPDEVRRDEEG